LALVLFFVATKMEWTVHLGQHEGGEHHEVQMPAYWSVLPFALLLGAIATFPLMRATMHWWENNLHKLYIAGGLAIVTLAYYAFLLSGGGFGKATQILEHAVLLEFIPFIILLFSLYTISGGIRIEGDLAAHPVTNAGFMVVGGLLASFIGTTGAAMLLIRPLLETNHQRKYVQHTVVFFIFVVCNCGGTLLPIGDPPLFMGYLKGVDFLWTLYHLWLPWLVVNVLIIAVYFVWDHFFAYPREPQKFIRRDEAEIRPLRITGLWPNALLLVGVILAVALLDASKPVPGTDWHPWPYLREAVQLSLVAVSLLLGSNAVRQANKFNYGAIIEVAALFIGIFICMKPAIEILGLKGAELGLTEPWHFFWASGTLSSMLDNAPTYLTFFETAAANPAFKGQNFAQLVNTDPKAAALLIGISLGSVFMGSMTYIGNGPNFMVKAIAESSGVKMPSFFGYVIFFSVPVLIPIFVLNTVLFLL